MVSQLLRQNRHRTNKFIALLASFVGMSLVGICLRNEFESIVFLFFQSSSNN